MLNKTFGVYAFALSFSRSLRFCFWLDDAILSRANHILGWESSRQDKSLTFYQGVKKSKIQFFFFSIKYHQKTRAIGHEKVINKSKER
jgi:hypothetical protein